MQTVQQLQAAGYQVSPAADAVSCTEVVSGQPFWFYNPKFHQDRQSIAQGLQAAAPHGSGFRLLVAGVFAGSDTFPFVLVGQAVKDRLADANARYHQHAQAAAQANLDYLQLLLDHVDGKVPA
jgi:hypothetical protein